MIGNDRKISQNDEPRKADQAQHFSDERAQLLDTIREMIDDELDRRGTKHEFSLRHGEVPAKSRRSLWQRIRDFFMGKQGK